MSTPESLALEAVYEYLQLRGYYVFRVNNGATYDPVKKIYRRPPKYFVHGVSDLIALKNGKCLFIEVKSKTGKQRPDQEIFQADVEAQGFDYYLVRNAEDCQKYRL